MSGSRFKQLKQLDVRSLKVNAAFTINMLTSCPRLEAVKISGSMPQVWDASIPPLDLVQLNHLELQIVPSNIDGPSFFSRLSAPKLEVLKISDVILDELQGFKFMSGLKELEIGNINSENRSYLGERDASDLLKILEKTSSLQTLGLHLKPKRTNYRFWNYFLSVLTPQSSHNLRKGGGEVFSILPSLRFLKLGGDSLQSPSVLPSELGLSDELVGSIASLVASRFLASSGSSKSLVALAANGSSVREELEELKEKGATSTDWSLSEWKPILYLGVHMNVKAEKRFVDTIKQVVPECHLPYSWVRFE